MSIEKEDNIVWISQILFRGKRKIPWEEVEEYLKQYVGKVYEISKTKDKIHIKADFPDEFSNSMDTVRLNGTAAKAKANAVQKVPELIRKAENKRFQENKKMKHTVDAQRGWYRYTTNFALPVYNEDGKILRYNVFSSMFGRWQIILVRYGQYKKKKRATRLSLHYTVTNPFLKFYFSGIEKCCQEKKEELIT